MSNCVVCTVCKEGFNEAAMNRITAEFIVCKRCLLLFNEEDTSSDENDGSDFELDIGLPAINKKSENVTPPLPAEELGAEHESFGNVGHDSKEGGGVAEPSNTIEGVGHCSKGGEGPPLLDDEILVGGVEEPSNTIEAVGQGSKEGEDLPLVASGSVVEEASNSLSDQRTSFPCATCSDQIVGLLLNGDRIYTRSAYGMLMLHSLFRDWTIGDDNAEIHDNRNWILFESEWVLLLS